MVGTDIFGRYRIFLTGDKGRVTKYVPDVMPYEQHYTTFTMRKLNSISLFMEDRLPYLWFAGEGFTLLKGNTELVVDVEEIENDFITDFELNQNYPNPFNPTTTIKFQIPESSFITIKIYDVLGNEITTLINEEKPAGVYEVEFDASVYSSGVYFYNLQAGNFIDVKKMILLK
ncbi:MAG: T9SS type A sorting domain-containing protein [Bacteroidetes bacterium]|nr:T9SS type A sorting domain-containing protein [Bacteroidota bacterium]